MKILIQRLPEAHDLPLPKYMSQGAAGMDLCAAVEGEVVLKPGEWQLIPTGLRVAIPPGYEGQIRPRSGLALQHGLSVVNAPGTVDSDYRGPVGVILINLGNKPYTVQRGDRIAQLLISPVARPDIELVEELEDTERSQGGFGHTGT